MSTLLLFITYHQDINSYCLEMIYYILKKTVYIDAGFKNCWLGTKILMILWFLPCASDSNSVTREIDLIVYSYVNDFQGGFG